MGANIINHYINYYNTNIYIIHILGTQCWRGISAQQSGEFGRMDEDEIQDKVEGKAQGLVSFSGQTIPMYNIVLPNRKV